MSLLGLCNRTCTIQRVTITRDAVSREGVQTYATMYGSVPCRLTGARGGEQRGDNRVVSRATHELFIPNNYTVLVTDRVIVDSVNYNVLVVRNGGGANHHIELDLEVVK